MILTCLTSNGSILKLDEIVEAASKVKLIGNEQFKAKKYEIAAKKYKKALR